MRGKLGRDPIEPQRVLAALELVVKGYTYSRAAATVGIHRNSLLRYRERLLKDDPTLRAWISEVRRKRSHKVREWDKGQQELAKLRRYLKDLGGEDDAREDGDREDVAVC